jgi:hypothetical protein
MSPDAQMPLREVDRALSVGLVMQQSAARVHARGPSRRMERERMKL